MPRKFEGYREPDKINCEVVDPDLEVCDDLVSVPEVDPSIVVDIHSPNSADDVDSCGG